MINVGNLFWSYCFIIKYLAWDDTRSVTLIAKWHSHIKSLPCSCEHYLCYIFRKLNCLLSCYGDHVNLNIVNILRHGFYWKLDCLLCFHGDQLFCQNKMSRYCSMSNISYFMCPFRWQKSGAFRFLDSLPFNDEIWNGSHWDIAMLM